MIPGKLKLIIGEKLHMIILDMDFGLLLLKIMILPVLLIPAYSIGDVNC